MRAVPNRKKSRPPGARSRPDTPRNSTSAPSIPLSGRRPDSGVRSGWLASLGLAAAFAGAALAFDSAADASFDAPKRIVSLAGIAAAALFAFGLSRWENPFSRKPTSPSGWRDPRVPLALGAAAAALAVVSAVASPHRALALDSLRVAAVAALLLPLGASRAVARRLPVLIAAFLAAVSIDAVVSILQARGLYQPFPLVTQAAREATGAFAGNVGYLALALALASVVALGIAATARHTGARVAGGAIVVLTAAALLVNQNLTSLSAFGVGMAILLFGLFRRKAAVPFAAGLLVFALAIGLYAPMRTRAVEAFRAARSGQWDTLLSYRTAPWAAAILMARDRPVLGFGPGTFGAEFVAHRLRADIASRRRLASPLVTSTYTEAHSDYLQPFAEAGIFAGLATLAAAALLVGGLARTAAALRGPERAEAVLLLAILAAGATAALTWFPFQRPITAIPLLFAAGRAWRVAGEPAAGADTDAAS